MRNVDPDQPVSTTRRAVLATLGAGALGAALWPRTPRSRVGVPSGRTVITYWEKWTGAEGDAVQAIVDRFNTSQDRIWVRRMPVTDIMSKAMVAIGGGDPPDIIGLYSYNVPQFAESRAAMSLDEFSSRTSTIDPGSYVPAVQQLLSYKGKQWGGVSSIYALALYYNRAVFRENGLDPDKPPRTIDELDRVADQLLTRDHAGNIERGGFLQNLPEWWPYFWPIMFGGSLYDPLADKAHLADARCAAAYEWVGRTASRLGHTDASRFANSYGRSFHSPQDPFMSGRVAMIVQGPWIANFIRLYTPSLDYGAASVPVESSIYDPEKPTGMLEADVLIIPRGCPHPDEAYEFLRFYQQPDVQAQLASSHAKSSPMRVTPPGFYEQHPNRYVRVHDAITRSPSVQILPQTRIWQQYADMILGAFQSVWAGKDVGTTLKDVETRAQQLIDLASLRRSQREGRA